LAATWQNTCCHVILAITFAKQGIRKHQTSPWIDDVMSRHIWENQCENRKQQPCHPGSATEQLATTAVIAADGCCGGVKAAIVLSDASMCGNMWTS